LEGVVAMDVLVWNVRPCSDKGFDTRDLSYEEEDTFMISIDMYNNDVGKRFMKQTGALGPHPLFCFISFIGIYYPLTTDLDMRNGHKGGVRVRFININDMYNNDVGKGVVYAYEAYEAK